MKPKLSPKRLLTFSSLLIVMIAGPLASQAANLPVTAEQQAGLTPGGVLDDLMAGNQRYVNGALTESNVRQRIEAAMAGQYPKAYVLSCVDSRVPVEDVFDQGLGDIFVGRVAGNFEEPGQLGSMEFAAAVAGVKLILVLGHEACGAVKGACDDVDLGHVTYLVENIEPAVNAVAGFENDGRNSKNKAFVDAVVHANVERTVADIRDRSEILSGLEREGEIKIVGAYYSLHDGSVTLID